MRKYDDSMKCMYTSHKDLQDRLDGTICRFNDTPVYVSLDGTNLKLWDVATRSVLIKTITPDDPRFDISMLDLGYFNYTLRGPEKKNVVLFMRRDPTKKYKQGTCVNYLRSHTIDGKIDNNWGSSAVLSQGFVDSLTGVFPSLDEVKEGEQYAISQNVAVERDNLGLLNIYYRTEKVACRTPDDKTHMIKGEYTWIVERLLGGLYDHAA